MRPFLSPAARYSGLVENARQVGELSVRTRRSTASLVPLIPVIVTLLVPSPIVGWPIAARYSLLRYGMSTKARYSPSAEHLRVPVPFLLTPRIGVRRNSLDGIGTTNEMPQAGQTPSVPVLAQDVEIVFLHPGQRNLMDSEFMAFSFLSRHCVGTAARTPKAMSQSPNALEGTKETQSPCPQPWQGDSTEIIVLL